MRVGCPKDRQTKPETREQKSFTAYHYHFQFVILQPPDQRGSTTPTQ